jgi:hypothetical protein
MFMAFCVPVDALFLTHTGRKIASFPKWTSRHPYTIKSGKCKTKHVGLTTSIVLFVTCLLTWNYACKRRILGRIYITHTDQRKYGMGMLFYFYQTGLKNPVKVPSGGVISCDCTVFVYWTVTWWKGNLLLSERKLKIYTVCVCIRYTTF